MGSILGTDYLGLPEAVGTCGCLVVGGCGRSKLAMGQQPSMGTVIFGVKAEWAGQGSEAPAIFSVTEKTACKVPG